MGNCPGVSQALCMEVCQGEMAPRQCGRHWGTDPLTGTGKAGGWAKGDALEPAPCLSLQNQHSRSWGSRARPGRAWRCREEEVGVVKQLHVHLHLGTGSTSDNISALGEAPAASVHGKVWAGGQDTQNRFAAPGP